MKEEALKLADELDSRNLFGDMFAHEVSVMIRKLVARERK